MVRGWWSAIGELLNINSGSSISLSLKEPFGCDFGKSKKNTQEHTRKKIGTVKTKNNTTNPTGTAKTPSKNQLSRQKTKATEMPCLKRNQHNTTTPYSRKSPWHVHSKHHTRLRFQSTLLWDSDEQLNASCNSCAATQNLYQIHPNTAALATEKKQSATK